MSKKKAVSDSTLTKLWRQAVLASWGHQDPISGTWGDENLECHHIIKRKHWVTRWDWKNGIPLTAESHRWMHEHPIAAQEKLSHFIDME